ncbi:MULTISPECIES: transporter substrate-binding domain-containing protein [unclassified Fusibacter]|uniref:transporter substrate-binding domain-containing protein n=1 Tax=unclassified Fusibacter TaxID=2624464 RepID=UPI001011564B|nr:MULTISPECIES: transporter substrate-binding domain-containing protein [unclassified Fusibacter]MCK8060817.1 transporter substrate-binding domain-containing protein [Fusibacter sp. A2]NPE23113.1 transporter substrate-binding domain-containing protein [Fusibacter sp. A1]RXV59784.1 hypothetical protein DWB64_14870 [Fusibacter sp. A1]
MKDKHRLRMPIFLVTLLLTVSVTHADNPILVQGDQSQPPISYVDDEVYKGFGIEIAHEILSAMNLSHTYKTSTYPQMLRNLTANTADMYVLMRYSKEDDARFDFSLPVVQMSDYLYVRKKEGLESIDDLNGKSLIVVSGSSLHDQAIRLGFSDSLVTVPRTEDALMLLKNGKHDAALLTDKYAQYYIDSLDLNTIKRIDQAVGTSNYCFAVRQGNTALTAQLNEGLLAIKASGKYDEIYEKWFGTDEKSAFSFAFFKFALYLTIPLVIIAAAYLTWRWYLDRQVDHMTADLSFTNERLVASSKRIIEEHSVNQLSEKMSAVNRLSLNITDRLIPHIGSGLSTTDELAKLTEQMRASLIDTGSNVGSFSHLLDQTTTHLGNLETDLNTVIQELKQLRTASTKPASARPTEFDLGKHVLQVTDNLRSAGILGAHELSVNCTEHLMVESNKDALKTVIEILVSNSLAHGFDNHSPGKISIEVHRKINEFEIIYKDTGHGVRSSDTLSLFEPYQKNDFSKGEGLGLPTLYQLVKHTLNGTVTFNSMLGHGVTVLITAPIWFSA